MWFDLGQSHFPWQRPKDCSSLSSWEEKRAGQGESSIDESGTAIVASSGDVPGAGPGRGQEELGGASRLQCVSEAQGLEHRESCLASLF